MLSRKLTSKSKKICTRCGKEITSFSWAEYRNKDYCWPCADAMTDEKNTKKDIKNEK